MTFIVYMIACDFDKSLMSMMMDNGQTYATA